MQAMAHAQIGPLTHAVESLAALTGAGIVLGSFVIGVAGLLLGWPRRTLAARALTDGYLGGLFAIFMGVLDLLGRIAK
jgi:hypothetical protein